MSRNWTRIPIFALSLLALRCLGDTLPPGFPGVPGASGSVLSACYGCGAPDGQDFSFSGTGSGQATATNERGAVISEGAQVQQTITLGTNGIDESVDLQISTFADISQGELYQYGQLQASENFDDQFTLDTPSVLHLTGSLGLDFNGFDDYLVPDDIRFELDGPGGTVFQNSGGNFNVYLDLQPGVYYLFGYIQMSGAVAGALDEAQSLTGVGDLSVSVDIVPEPRWTSLLPALLLPFLPGLRRRFIART
jgi:hypothetical protein